MPNQREKRQKMKKTNKQMGVAEETLARAWGRRVLVLTGSARLPGRDAGQEHWRVIILKIIFVSQFVNGFSC
jgi:hypothetical protein